VAIQNFDREGVDETALGRSWVDFKYLGFKVPHLNLSNKTRLAV